MVRTVLLSAFITGLFCAAFAGVVDLATGALSLPQIMLAGLVSGFLGSVVAHFIMKNRNN